LYGRLTRLRAGLYRIADPGQSYESFAKPALTAFQADQFQMQDLGQFSVQINT
jgi:hypothetical protein